MIRTSFGSVSNRNVLTPALAYQATTPPRTSPTSIITPRSPEHHADDVPARRAERHPHADLVGALRDDVGHDAVDADRRDHQAEHAEQREHASC